MNIKDKVAIVTGASSGIGLATSYLLSKNGAKVVLAARSKEKINKLSKELPNSISITTDMTNEKDIKNMVEKAYNHFGRIDILINNAGQGYDSSLEKIDINIFRKIFELDLLGPVIAMQSVIPVMRKQKSGAIVSISSGTSLMYLPNMSPYSSMKRALNGVSLTAREELAKDNIIVSVIYPYITKTNFEKNTIKENGEEEWSQDEINNLPPFDPPEHVAEKILEAIQSGKAEIYAHDWMKTPR